MKKLEKLVSMKTKSCLSLLLFGFACLGLTRAL